MSADKYPERHKRDLLLSDRISQGTVKDIIKDIFEINFDDDEKEEIYKDWERKPIQLFINSYGGSVYDGLALIDVIKRSKTPVHTVCIGSCMSMALWVWLSGAKRFVGESATLMFHDVSLFAYRYVNYDIEKVENDYYKCKSELDRAQLQLDLVNSTVQLTVDDLVVEG